MVLPCTRVGEGKVNHRSSWAAAPLLSSLSAWSCGGTSVLLAGVSLPHLEQEPENLQGVSIVVFKTQHKPCVPAPPAVPALLPFWPGEKLAVTLPGTLSGA